MSGFLYRYQVRDAIDHAAILRRIYHSHSLMDFPQTESGNAGAVTLKSTELALDQRDLYFFCLSHDLSL